MQTDSGTPVAVFDIGRVLVEWEPQRHYDRTLGPQHRRRLFAEVDLEGMNARVDAGASLRDEVTATAARHPEWAPAIRDWHLRWSDLIGPEIPGTVALMRALRRRGHPVWALTNFGAETFEVALDLFPVLREFDGTVVSGRLSTIKPDPEIYAALEVATGAQGGRIFFTDDKAENVAAAAARGWRTHLFQGPETLAARLVSEGLLDASEAQSAAEAASPAGKA